MVSYAGQHRVDPAVAWDGWSHVLFDDKGRPLLEHGRPSSPPRTGPRYSSNSNCAARSRDSPQGRSAPPVAAKYLLSGILTCGKCGHGLVGAWPGRREDPARREYRCPPSAYGGCNGTSIVAAAAEKAVTQGMETFLTMLFDTADADRAEDPARLASLRARMEEESGRKRKLIKCWTAGTLSDIGLNEDDYLLMMAGLNSKIGGIQAEITTAEGGGHRKISRDELVRNWREGSVQQRRTILKRYLHGVTVLPPVRNLPDGVSPIQGRLEPRWKSKEEIAA